MLFFCYASHSVAMWLPHSKHSTVSVVKHWYVITVKGREDRNINKRKCTNRVETVTGAHVFPDGVL